MPLTMPDGVLGMADRGPAWAAWVDGLPRTVDTLLEEWSLRLDDLPMHGFVGLVVPVVTDTDREAVLKLSFPDDDTAHEHLALRRWGGRGAVELLRADPRRRALLLDRLRSRTTLSEVEVGEACEAVAASYAHLHVPATEQYPRLSALAGRWAEELAALPRRSPLPHRLVEQAASLARDLAADDATDGTLLHYDLHYDNVLAAPEGSSYAADWVVIDPKPLSGDPHLEPAPMLWNRWDEAVAGGDVRAAVRHRFHTIIDAAGLDEARAQAWMVLRLVAFGLQQVHERGPGSEELLTRAVTAAKAVQGDD